MKKYFLNFAFVFLFILPVLLPARAAEKREDDDTPQKYTSRQVGGLLFDMDEGVAVEEGPGGSVYVKSNREYMQKKFKEIDKRFEALESRVASLESQWTEKRENKRKGLGLTAPESSEAEKKSGEKSEEDEKATGEILGRRVLST